MAAIALDWDGTFTADPILWVSFISQARRNGHQVYIVTMRHPDEAVRLPSDTQVDGIYYTGRQAKLRFVEERGLKIDIWIDDRPDFILYPAV